MPGMAMILGGPRDRETLRRAIEAMIGALTYAGHQTATFVDEETGVAAAHTAPVHTGGSSLGCSPDGDALALVEGEPVGLPEPEAGMSPADRLAAFYATRGPQGLEGLRGHWAAAIIDRQRRTVTIANDAFGIRALFRMRGPAGAAHPWLIATSPAALLAYPGVERAVSLAGLADYLAFGYPLGSHTLFAGMDRLPAATLLTFSQDGLSERKYWAPIMQQDRRFSEADLEAMRRDFNEHVLAAAEQNGPASVAMSGGGDSRAILSALVAGGHRVDTLTHAVAGATDARIGEQLAAIAGARHHFYETRGEDIGPHIAEGVRMLAGRAAGIEFHPLAFLPEYPTFTRAMLTGLGGNLFKGNFLTGEPGSRSTSVPELVRWLTARHNNLIHTYCDFEPLLTDEWCAALREQPERSVTEVVERLDPETPVARRSVVFYLEERASKYLVKGDSFVRREIETRHPFMDRELLLRSWRFPTEARVRGIIPSYIITRNAPQLLGVEVTYAAGSGWPLRPYTRASLHRIGSHISNMQATARELVRARRQPPPPAVANYRYGEWLRGALRPFVEDVLLDPHTLGRPYFRQETVRAWVSEHMAGQSHGSKLSALLSLELTLRAFVDAAPVTG